MYDRGPMLNLSFSLLGNNPDEMEKIYKSRTTGEERKKG